MPPYIKKGNTLPLEELADPEIRVGLITLSVPDVLVNFVFLSAGGTSHRSGYLGVDNQGTDQRGVARKRGSSRSLPGYNIDCPFPRLGLPAGQSTL